MKKTVLLILTNVLSVIGLFALMEVGVRMIMPEIGPIGTEKTLINDDAFNGRGGLAKNAEGTSNGALVQTDERRVIAYSRPFDSSLNSVLFLGDSVTMGLGVQSDSTFAGLLSGSMDSLNILNTALIGYNGTDYKAVVDSFLSVKSPLEYDWQNVEQVVVFWCLNDIYKDVPPSTIPGGMTRKFGAGILPFIRRHFRLYQVLKNAFFDRSRSYYEHDAFYYAPFGQYYQHAILMLEKIQKICNEQGVGLQVVLLPYEYQLRTHLPADSLNIPQKLFKKDLQARNIPVTDAFSFMRSMGDSKELYLYGDGIHFSNAGHRVFAEWVLREVL